MKIPEGYATVSWLDVKAGDTVYLNGTCNGIPYAYGPHTVISVIGKRLRNPKGVEFPHYPEHLLRKAKP